MAAKAAEKGKAERKAAVPIGGSVNISRKALDTAKAVAEARGTSIRAITEGAIKDAYVRKFGAAKYKEVYGKD